MAKGGISWLRKNDDGTRTEVHARLVGNVWRFSARSKRHEEWRPLDSPLHDDWIELEDAVDRRVTRGLMKPEQLQSVRAELKKRFPRGVEPPGQG